MPLGLHTLAHPRMAARSTQLTMHRQQLTQVTMHRQQLYTTIRHAHCFANVQLLAKHLAVL